MKTKDNIKIERERAKKLWEFNAQSPDNEWGEPVNIITTFKLPTEEEQEAFNDWLYSPFSDDYENYSDGQLRLDFQTQLFASAKETALKYRDQFCVLYARVRPRTESDFVALTVLIVDFLFYEKLKTSLSIGSIAFLVVRGGMLDQICPNARKAAKR